MHISIDPDLCTGHGRCYVVAPDLVEPDDEGRGLVRSAEVPERMETQARTAAGSCPERAVELDA